VEKIFPRLGETDTTHNVLKLLKEAPAQGAAIVFSIRLSALNGSKKGKIVLPCRPRFQPKVRLFYPALFAADSAFAPATRSTPTLRQGALS
jgi:hypothetical protein